MARFIIDLDNGPNVQFTPDRIVLSSTDGSADISFPLEPYSPPAPVPEAAALRNIPEPTWIEVRWSFDRKLPTEQECKAAALALYQAVCKAHPRPTERPYGENVIWHHEVSIDQGVVVQAYFTQAEYIVFLAATQPAPPSAPQEVE